MMRTICFSPTMCENIYICIYFCWFCNANENDDDGGRERGSLPFSHTIGCIGKRERERERNII